MVPDKFEKFRETIKLQSLIEDYKKIKRFLFKQTNQIEHHPLDSKLSPIKNDPLPFEEYKKTDLLKALESTSCEKLPELRLSKLKPNVNTFNFSNNMKERLFSKKSNFNFNCNYNNLLNSNFIMPSNHSTFKYKSTERNKRRSVDSLWERKTQIINPSFQLSNIPNINNVHNAYNINQNPQMKTDANYKIGGKSKKIKMSHSTIMGNFRSQSNSDPKISNLVSKYKQNMEINTENQILQIDNIIKLVLLK